ncbi:MAG: hypothetical protein FRX49_03000 [Trebouxia sp. A1-2]|nr:MAG: hypothetical protein FRX49_03000 [Trebouxia sp. A1-2]
MDDGSMSGQAEIGKGGGLGAEVKPALSPAGERLILDPEAEVGREKGLSAGARSCPEGLNGMLIDVRRTAPLLLLAALESLPWPCKKCHTVHERRNVRLLL